MKILSVYDECFRPYGKVLEGYDTAELVQAMTAIPLPESGTAYRPGMEKCWVMMSTVWSRHWMIRHLCLRAWSM